MEKYKVSVATVGNNGIRDRNVAVYSRSVPLPVDGYEVVDDVLAQAVHDAPHGVVDGPAVQHHHVQRDVPSEEQDLVAQLFVHVDAGGEVLGSSLSIANAKFFFKLLNST